MSFRLTMTLAHMIILETCISVTWTQNYVTQWPNTTTRIPKGHYTLPNMEPEKGPYRLTSSLKGSHSGSMSIWGSVVYDVLLLLVSKWALFSPYPAEGRPREARRASPAYLHGSRPPAFSLMEPAAQEFLVWSFKVTVGAAIGTTSMVEDCSCIAYTSNISPNDRLIRIMYS